MRYELAQTIISSDNSAITALLEQQLRKVSRTVRREGTAIVAVGIESSFGSINRVTRAHLQTTTSNNKTLIVVDVLYRPSGWFWLFELLLFGTVLGWIVPIIFYLTQRGSVKSALLDVLSRVKSEAEFASHNIETPLPQLTITSSEPSILTPHCDEIKPDVAGAKARPPEVGDRADKPGLDRASEKDVQQAKFNVFSIILVCITLTACVIASYLLGLSHRNLRSPDTMTATTAGSTVPKDQPAPSPNNISDQTLLHNNETQNADATANAGMIEEVHDLSTESAADAAITDAVMSWKQAMLSNDPVQLAECYAAHLDRFYLQSNVDNKYVLEYWTAEQANGNAVLGLDIDNLRFTHGDGPDVQVDFFENLTATQNGLRKQSKVHTVLIFTDVEDAWKIRYERQLLK